MKCMKLYSSAVCAPGLLRNENQDNLYINGTYRGDIADRSVLRYGDEVRDRGLYAVADGMGGEEHGELASVMVVRQMSAVDVACGSRGVLEYLEERNTEVCDLITENGGARIGTTFAGLCVNDKLADVINIGDSRVYFLRGSEFVQVSRDHTSVRQMVDLGLITKEAARFHPDQHKLTQHIGIFPSELLIEPYTTCIKLKKNDLFLLCSDGLTDMVDDYAIESVLKSALTLDEKTEALYEAAVHNGGRDNVTILLVEVKKA